MQPERPWRKRLRDAIFGKPHWEGGPYPGHVPFRPVPTGPPVPPSAAPAELAEQPPKRSVAVRMLLVMATNGPVAWLGNWQHRANAADIREWMAPDEPMTLADVLPWQPRRLKASESASSSMRPLCVPHPQSSPAPPESEGGL